MDKAEIVKLREFLRRSFGAPTLQVAPNSKSGEAADVSLGERKLGTITVDDEDGDRSFAFDMKVPVGRPVLQEYLRRLFENDKLTIAGRLKKTELGRTQQWSRFSRRHLRRRSRGVELHVADGDPRRRSRRRGRGSRFHPGARARSYPTRMEAVRHAALFAQWPPADAAP